MLQPIPLANLNPIDTALALRIDLQNLSQKLTILRRAFNFIPLENDFRADPRENDLVHILDSFLLPTGLRENNQSIHSHADLLSIQAQIGEMKNQIGRAKSCKDAGSIFCVILALETLLITSISLNIGNDLHWLASDMGAGFLMLLATCVIMAAASWTYGHKILTEPLSPLAPNLAYTDSAAKQLCLFEEIIQIAQTKGLLVEPEQEAIQLQF